MKCYDTKCRREATYVSECWTPHLQSRPHKTYWCEEHKNELQQWPQTGVKWSRIGEIQNETEEVQADSISLLPCFLCGELPTWYEGQRGRVSLWHTCGRFFNTTVHFKLGKKEEHIKRWNERMSE